MFASPENDFVSGAAPIGVSALVLQARRTLEQNFPLQWVAGEVSSLTRAASGHLYFTLRDAAAQVRCVMYRNRAQLIPFRLAEGQQVEIRALVTLYEARGEFQLQVEAVRQAGRGNLFEAFLKLKERLTAEGLFDPSRKRPVPVLPRGIGIITSLQAAALRDVLVTLRRRAPHLPVVVYPSPVQGEGAAARLAEGVRVAARRAAGDGIELLLVCRGGGSLEDLWSFNDESLARAIAASPLPVICGVGHETDFTLADFAADLRAPTPTAAAELASAGHWAARQRCTDLNQQLVRAIRQRIATAWERCDRARSGLRHPRQALAMQREQLGRQATLLEMRLRQTLQAAAHRLALLQTRLRAHRPQTGNARQSLAHLDAALGAALSRRLRQQREQLQTLGAHLAHLAPQAVLERGYAIVRRADGSIVRDALLVGPGERLEIQAARGKVQVRAETVPATRSNPDASSS